MRGNATRRRSRGVTCSLLGCGAVAGPIFLGTAVAEGAVRADYHPLRHPVSSLALGSRGGVQAANFAVTGLLMLAGTLGLSRAEWAARTRTGPVLLAAAGVGMLGSAAFVTDPVSGYPPGTPDQLTERTTPGLLHDLFGVPTFLGLPTAEAVYAAAFWRGGRRGWAMYSAGSSVAMLATFMLASAAFAQTPALVRFGGLLQRIAVGSGFGWLTAVAVDALRRLPR
jgi:hypothetical protein